MNKISFFVLALALLMLGVLGNHVEHVHLVLNATWTDEVYTVQCGEYAYFSVHQPYPCMDLVVSVNPTQGEPDIHISRNVEHPKRTNLTWAAYEDNDYVATVSLWDPESSPGYYYISVYADCHAQSSAAVFTIKANVTADASEDMWVYPALGKYCRALKD
jgi:hypothetical protein